MPSLQVYLRESRGRLLDLDSWIGLLYGGKDVWADIAAALQGLRRDAGFMGIAPVAHLAGALEGFFAGIRETGRTLNFFRLQLVQACLSALTEGLRALEEDGACRMDSLDGLVQTLEVATVQDSFAIKGGMSTAAEKGRHAAGAATGDRPGRVSPSGTLPGGDSLEVPRSQLDSLLRSFDRILARHVQLQASMSDVAGRLATGALESIQQAHWPLVVENMAGLKDCTLALQEQLIALQHLPLQKVLDEVASWAEGEAGALGRRVQVEIPPADIRMDGQILQVLPGILTTLMGMAMHYGIEDAGERLALGKPEAGRLSVLVRRQSSRVVVTVRDDGRGIDLEAVRSRVAELGLVTSQQLDAMTDQDLYRFLFMPEFSVGWTWRGGAGLPSVLHEVDRLGGSLRISSRRQHGSSIEMSLPTSLLFQEGICVQAGGRRLVVLAHYVQEILTVDKADILQSNAARHLVLHGDVVPVYNLALLMDKRLAEGKATSGSTLMIVLYLGKRWGLEVDELLYRKTVLAKPLPPLLRNLEALQGLVLDDEQRLIPIIHIPSVLSRFQQLDDYTIRSFEVNSRRRRYGVLVVEDSVGTSQIERMLLEQEGYRVDTATDGIEALELLKSRHYDLVVTDIHMPRMDGLVLIKNLRRLEDYRDVPVVVVSAVPEEGMMEQVALAGGQAYISKPHFQRERLVSLVGDLLHG